MNDLARGVQAEAEPAGEVRDPVVAAVAIGDADPVLDHELGGGVHGLVRVELAGPHLEDAVLGGERVRGVHEGNLDLMGLEPGPSLQHESGDARGIRRGHGGAREPLVGVGVVVQVRGVDSRRRHGGQDAHAGGGDLRLDVVGQLGRAARTEGGEYAAAEGRRAEVAERHLGSAGGELVGQCGPAGHRQGERRQEVQALAEVVGDEALLGDVVGQQDGLGALGLGQGDLVLERAVAAAHEHDLARHDLAAVVGAEAAADVDDVAGGPDERGERVAEGLREQSEVGRAGPDRCLEGGDGDGGVVRAHGDGQR